MAGSLQCWGQPGRLSEGWWNWAQWKQCTDTELLFAVSNWRLSFSFKVWNRSSNEILSFVLPSFQKEWKFVEYACNSGRRGGIKLQTVLLKTAWAAFVWTCKTQQLNASIVRRGKYANSKHISHQKPFQGCHRGAMKAAEGGRGRAVLWERGPGHCAPAVSALTREGPARPRAVPSPASSSLGNTHSFVLSASSLSSNNRVLVTRPPPFLFQAAGACRAAGLSSLCKGSPSAQEMGDAAIARLFFSVMQQKGGCEMLLPSLYGYFWCWNKCIYQCLVCIKNL